MAMLLLDAPELASLILQHIIKRDAPVGPHEAGLACVGISQSETCI